MTEKVSTGGLKSFDYKSNTLTKLSDKEKREIHEAYAKAEERKRKEKLRNQVIIIGSILLIICIGIVVYLLK